MKSDTCSSFICVLLAEEELGRGGYCKETEQLNLSASTENTYSPHSMIQFRSSSKFSASPYKDVNIIRLKIEIEMEVACKLHSVHVEFLVIL